MTGENSSEADAVALMTLLNELCEMLSIGVEDMILNFSFEQIVNPLVWILQNYLELPELLILAARALTYMVEISPSVGASIAQSRAVQALCGSLLHVEYIDLAEQCLQALERLSYNYPNQIIRNGGLRALLQHLDFFPTSIQRMASLAAANCCARVNESLLEQVGDSLELMSHLLDNDDTRIKEHGIAAYARLVGNLSTCSNAQSVLKRIANDGDAIVKLVSILAGGESSLDRRHRGLILRILSGFASFDQELRSRMLGSSSTGGLGLRAIIASLLGAAPDCHGSMPADETSPRMDSRVRSNTPAYSEALVGSALMLVDALSPDYALVQRLQKVLDLHVRVPAQDQGTKECRRHALSAMKKTLFALESDVEILNFSVELIPTLGYVLHDPVDDEERSTAMDMIEHILEHVPPDERIGELFVKEGVVHELEGKAAEHGPAQRILDRFGDQLRSAGRLRVLKLRELVERLQQGDHRALSALVSELRQSSVFEIQSSQLIWALNTYLSAEKGAAAELADRYSHLLLATVPMRSALQNLIWSLVAILANAERFEVVTNPAANGNVSSGVRLLAQPFRLQIRRGPIRAATRLHDFPPSIVLVEPLASAQTIEEFLYARVTGDVEESDALEEDEVFDAESDDEDHDDHAAFEAAAESVEDSTEDEHTLVFDQDGLSDSAASGDAPPEHQQRGGETLHCERALNESNEAEATFSDREGANLEDDEEESDEFSDIGEGFDELGPEHGLENPNLSTSLPAVDIELSDNASGSSSSLPGSEQDAHHLTHSASNTYAARTGRFSRATNISPPASRQRRTGQGTAKRDAGRRRLRLSLSVRGHTLSPQETMLHALANTMSTRVLGPRLWAETHELLYTESTNSWSNPPISPLLSNGDGQAAGHRFAGDVTEFELVQGPSFQFRIPKCFHLGEIATAEVSACLSLLSKLHWMNRHHAELEAWIHHSRERFEAEEQQVRMAMLHWPSCEDPLIHEPDAFACSKLESKLRAQLCDPLAVAAAMLPSWCFVVPQLCPPLFSLQTRRLLIQVSSFGIARALSAVQASADTQRQQRAAAGTAFGRSDLGASALSLDHEARVGRIQRQKVRVHRTRLLESAELIMEKFADQKALIEVEYFNEAGTGLGPTLEFYSMVSRELQRVDLKLWWEDTSKVAERERLLRSGKPLTPLEHERIRFVVSTGAGLYPAPIGPRERGASVQQRLRRFQFMGRFCAKALLDGRLLDLRFSPAFWRLVRSLAEASHNISERLTRHRALFRAAKARIDLSLTRLVEVDAELARSLHSIAQMRLASEEDIAALCLDWTLPGHPQIEMRPRGRSMSVSKHTLDDYIRAVTEHVLFDCAVRPAYAFLEGFQSICSIWSLMSVFSPDEEANVALCGPDIYPWTEQELLSALRFDHGYTSESTTARYLVRALCSLSEEDRRHFLLFATGSPRLPVGGFHALLPPMTVVKRTPEAGLTPDECLPTVMTCTNYIKLPEYSSFEMLMDRLVYTIREGQNSFDLS
jgi:hypothetical protein